MKLRCIRTSADTDLLTRDLAARRNPDLNRYNLEFGQVYLAIGIGFWRGSFWAEIVTSNIVVPVPLQCFEFVTRKPSQYWEARHEADGSFTLWPPSMYDCAYHDRLADDDPEIVRDFQRLCELIASEDSESGIKLL